MKKTLISSLFLVFTLATFVFPADVQYPANGGYVTDLANVIGQDYSQKISQLADELQQNTGAQLAVATVKTTRPLDTKSYAVELFKRWGIGEQGKDNGLLILFAAKEKRIEVEVGYGLEGIITDGYVGSVLDKFALPSFKEKDYGKGIYLAVAAFADKINKEYSSSPRTRFEQVNVNILSVAIALSVIILVFVLIMIGGSIGGMLVSGAVGSVIGYMMSGVLGAFFGFFIGLMISGGGYYGGYGGYGGFGGGFGGGGSSGFGGFGGGRSGGGGAGRSF